MAPLLIIFPVWVKETVSASDSTPLTFCAYEKLQTLVPSLCRGRISSLIDKCFLRKMFCSSNFLCIKFDLVKDGYK